MSKGRALRRRRTLRGVLSSDSSLLHVGGKVDFFAMAGMPKTAEPAGICTNGSNVTVTWIERSS
jgi:hypothetical protein